MMKACRRTGVPHARSRILDHSAVKTVRKCDLCVTVWGCVHYPPMKAVTLGLMMPLGRRWKSYSTESTTTVCPALLPPCRGESGTQTWHRELRPVGVLLALRSEVKAFCYDSFLPLSRRFGRRFCTFRQICWAVFTAWTWIFKAL